MNRKIIFLLVLFCCFTALLPAPNFEYSRDKRYSKIVGIDVPKIDILFFSEEEDTNPWRMELSFAPLIKTRLSLDRIVGIAKDTNITSAKKYADEHPEITGFFHVRVANCDLNIPEKDILYVLQFEVGDFVFFTGRPLVALNRFTRHQGTGHDIDISGDVYNKRSSFN